MPFAARLAPAAPSSACSHEVTRSAASRRRLDASRCAGWTASSSAAPRAAKDVARSHGLADGTGWDAVVVIPAEKVPEELQDSALLNGLVKAPKGSWVAAVLSGGNVNLDQLRGLRWN